jgi:hypothetical protein
MAGAVQAGRADRPDEPTAGKPDGSSQSRCDLQVTEIPVTLQSFVERHEYRDHKQLTLLLV